MGLYSAGLIIGRIFLSRFEKLNFGRAYFCRGRWGWGWGFLSELNGNQIRISKCTWIEEQNRAQFLLYRYKEGVPLRYELVLILIKGLNFSGGGGASHEKLFSTPSPLPLYFQKRSFVLSAHIIDLGCILINSFYVPSCNRSFP